MKYLISASAAVLMLSGVSADIVEQQEAPAEEVEVLEADQACNCDLLNGFYAGLGIGFSRTKNSDLLKVKNWATQTADGKLETFNNKANKFIGTVVAGAGKVFGGGFYCGGEAMIDFSKNKKKYETYNDAAAVNGQPAIGGVNTGANSTFVTKTENKGFEWNLGVRAGYAVQNGTLVYAKLGVTQGKVKEDVYVAQSATEYKTQGADNVQPYMRQEGNNGVAGSKLPVNKNCNKVAPMLALGVEKVMSNGLSGRLELEYDFKAKKKFDNPAVATEKSKLTKKNAFKARLMLSKHISM